MGNTKETSIYLVRHGITKSNKLKIYAGWNEEELDEEGVLQVEKLGKKIKSWSIPQIYTSPIKRAIQTAHIINKYIRAEFIIEPDLIEMKLGAWEGMSEEQVALTYPREYKIWITKPAELKLNGRESLESVQERSVRTVNKILSSDLNKKFLIVTHVAIIRSLILFFKGFNLNQYKRIHVPNASIFEFKFQEKGIQVKKL
jgi:broad specificity phosphatase PhoE